MYTSTVQRAQNVYMCYKQRRVFIAYLNPNLVNDSNVRVPCMQGALDEAMACPNKFGVIVI